MRVGASTAHVLDLVAPKYLLRAHDPSIALLPMDCLHSHLVILSVNDVHQLLDIDRIFLDLQRLLIEHMRRI